MIEALIALAVLAAAAAVGMSLHTASSSARARPRWTTPPVEVTLEGPAWTVHRDELGDVHLGSELVFEGVERMVVGFAITTRGMQVGYLNPAAEVALGWTLEELQAAGGFRAAIHPEDLGKADLAVERAVDGVPFLEHRNRWIGRDGTVRHLVWWGSGFDARGISVSTCRLEEIEDADLGAARV